MFTRTVWSMTLVVAITLAMATACGGGEPEEKRDAEPLTIEAYADIACIPEEETVVALGGDWGMSRERLEELLPIIESAKPPPGLMEYHLARIAAFRLILDVSKEKDPNALYNPYDLTSNPDNLLLLTVAAEASDAVQGEAREVLTAAGCIAEE